MRKTRGVFAFILFFGVFALYSAAAQSPAAVSGAESGWTKEGLQNIYLEHLRVEGYVPSIDVDGDIQFKVSGDNYFIIIDENDLQFFQVYTGFSLGAVALENALNAANSSNRRSKVAKVTISPEGPIASITAELLIDDPKDFAPVFARALSLMRNAENNFFNFLKE